MSLLDKLFGKEESPDQETVVDTTASIQTEVKQKAPEVVDGDQPLIGK